MVNSPLILASGSPWRRTLLEQTGLPFDWKDSGVNEEQFKSKHPAKRALTRAEAKANKVLEELEGPGIVIACDQVLGFKSKCLGKVALREDARLRLRLLSGRTHMLWNALVILERDEKGQILKPIHKLLPVSLLMRPLDDDEIESYLDTDEWQGTVGCYRFEGKGVHLFKKVDGDQSKIIGLPLLELLAELRKRGYGLSACQSPSDTLS